MTTNKLKLNEAKTDCLLVYSDSARVKPICMPLMVGSSPVLPSTLVHYLGAGLDSQLSKDAQILATRKRLYFTSAVFPGWRDFCLKPPWLNCSTHSFFLLWTATILFWSVVLNLSYVCFKRFKSGLLDSWLAATNETTSLRISNPFIGFLSANALISRYCCLCLIV